MLLSQHAFLLFTHLGWLLFSLQKLIFIVPWLWVNGMTIWPFVLLRRPNPSARLLNHERIHLRQQLELGIVPFYIWYFSEYGYWRLRGRDHYTSYRSICFEREAFNNDDDLTYLNKRPFWAFLKNR
jgi:hypothetical protein